MLSFLLKCFPRRFQEGLGQEWLLDTRQELTEARAQGRLPYSKACLRTVLSFVQGASSAHVHEARWQLTQARQQVALAGGFGQWTTRALPPGVASEALLMQVGAALCGHQMAALFIRFWVEEGLGQMASSQELEGTFMALSLASSPLILLGVGIYLVFNGRAREVRSSNKWLSSALALSMAALFCMAAAATYLTWTLRDLGRSTIDVIHVFEEYPLLQKSLGLRVDEEDPKSAALFLPNGEFRPEIKEARCQRAEAAFESASVRWQRRAQEQGDLVPLLLLKLFSQQLWNAGCWEEPQALAYSAELSHTAEQIGKWQSRQMHYRMLGKLKESYANVLPKIPYKREEVCLHKIGCEQLLPLTEAVHYCSQIAYPKASVHSKGNFELKENDVIAWKKRHGKR